MAGFWDSLFDFNSDGKTDPGEEWIAFKMFGECMKEDGADDKSADDFDDPFEWRLYCEDGSEYGISPDDYSSEYEYEDALKQAKDAYKEQHKYDWREGCADNNYGIAPEDFETEDEYDFAVAERENNWEDYLSDEILEKMEAAFVEADEFSSEDELLEFLAQWDEASKQPPEPLPPPVVNQELERSLSTGDKAKVLEALRVGMRTDAKLTIPVQISMDPADGAGPKCVYVAMCEKRNGRWALAYTSQETAENAENGAGANITYSQECLLRSLVLIRDIDGVMFQSASQSFCLNKQDLIDLLAESKPTEEAWDAICTCRSLLSNK